MLSANVRKLVSLQAMKLPHDEVRQELALIKALLESARQPSTIIRRLQGRLEFATGQLGKQERLLAQAHDAVQEWTAEIERVEQDLATI
eukprot:7749977-Prorocentrum_lima.AAC.1